MHVFTATLTREDPEITLLVAQYSSDLSFESLFDQIYRGYPEDRLRASAIVVRADVRDQFDAQALALACEGRAPPTSPFLTAAAAACGNPSRHFNRFAELPVLVLYGDDCEPRLSGNVNPLATPSALIATHLEHAETIADLRDAELRCLMDKSRAYLLPIEGSFYDPPSHRPARSFLRVGNIQYSAQAIDAVTYWLLPHLKESRAILVDTWSLSSIAFNASRVLAAIRGEPPITVEMLSHYQDDSEQRRAALIEILDRLTADVSIHDQTDAPVAMTCIVSATQTGSLVEVLEDQIQLSGLDIALRFVAVFRLGKTGELPALCDLSDHPGFAPLDTADLSSRVTIPIDPQVYFPLTYKDVEHLPLAADAAPFKPFLELVRGHGILSVHRDQPSDNPVRHHGIHVDTETLFALPAFEEPFRAAIRALTPPPSLIITPLHAAARRLADLAVAEIAEKVGIPPLHFEHTSLQLSETGPRAATDAVVRKALLAVPADSAILVLDDCFITGARMTGYQTRLRQIALRPRLHYLVGLARPDDPLKWSRFQRLVGFRPPDARELFHDNTVGAIIETCLPNLQRHQCPWCQEALLLEPLIGRDANATLPAFLAKRLTRLGDTAAGLRDDLFLNDAADAPLKLYSGSVFAEEGSSQAEVFASLAAALQRLRVHPNGDRPLLGPRHYPIATVIKAEDYLLNTYTDSILRASILRAATVEELVYTARELEAARIELITSILTSPESDVHDLAPELVLAHLAGKCTIAPRLVDSRLPARAAELLALAREPTAPEQPPPGQPEEESWSV